MGLIRIARNPCSHMSTDPTKVGSAGELTITVGIADNPFDSPTNRKTAEGEIEEGKAVESFVEMPDKMETESLVIPEPVKPPSAAPGRPLSEQLVPLIGVPVKWFALIFLVVQNSSASLLMRWSRSAPGQHDWDPQVGVIMQEVMKGITCMILLMRENDGLSSAFTDKRGFLLTSIPAFLYLIQNNMQYVAVTHLSAPVYAVLYQTKILSTGILSVVVLGKTLSRFQWMALGALTVGVAFVSLSQNRGSSSGKDKRYFVGIVSVLFAAFISGLAGVSFEKILKGAQASLWARNLQLALYSIVIGVAGLFMQGNYAKFRDEGVFHGFTTAAWLSIMNNAFGGLLIAVVIKYADNIMKNFSQGLSLILTAILSCVMFECVTNSLFALGVALVIYSVVLYGNVIHPVPQAIMELLKQ